MILNIFSCNSYYVVGHCITLLRFSYASKSVPLSTRKKPTNLDWAKVFFLPSSLMSNARNWCKLTDGEQIILITNKQSLRNLTKFFEVAQKMQVGSPMKIILSLRFSTFTDSKGRHGSPQQSSQNIVDRLSILNSFLSNLATLRPLSFVNL